jgi:hypothetical protein
MTSGVFDLKILPNPSVEMFRRLAEAFETENNTGSDASSGNAHLDYVNKQNAYYNAAPNMILSGTSGLPGFDTAIQTSNTIGQGIQNYAVKNPNDIFMTGVSPNLTQMATQCSASALDNLIAAKNPNAPVGCGWMYTGPTKNSPYSEVSKGMVGNAKGPLPGFDVPNYKKWFFDLQLAKKQLLMDKCKALKACTDVDSDVFQGSCGYCTDIGQGVPIDSVGKPLYPNESMGSCSPGSIVRSGASCPPPPTGPQPVRDKTCDPVNGRLSAACLYNTAVLGGCTDNGAMAMALKSSPNPSDYMASLRNTDAMTIYQRAANPPINLNLFSQGQTTVGDALQEIRQLASNATKPASSAIGAAARDLCLQRGAIKGYDQCSNLPDGTQSPFDMACLQQLFLKMGGQPKGKAFPTIATMATYNAMGTLGAVKQYWMQLLTNMKSADGFVDYATQRNAMIQFLGISPENTIVRAPYSQGVEVLWFVPVPGNPQKVAGFLKRTVERDIVQLQAGPSRVPQIGGGAFGCCIQMMDVRAPSNFSAKFTVTVDDGFWIAINQPANIDKTAMAQRTADVPGLFENLGLQGPTMYQSNACTPLNAATPNIVKMYYEDAGGGWNAFQVTPQTCNGVNAFQSQYYSLTCEARAPFLTYEVGKSGAFEELRNPGLFGQFMEVSNPEYHVRTDERSAVPGKKSFTRMKGSGSYLYMPNIAFQSWKSMSFAVRFQTMPVKETLCHLMMGTFGQTFSIIATPVNGSTSVISVQHGGMGGKYKTITTNYYLTIGTWYLFYINNNKTGFDLYCNSFDGFTSSGGAATITTLAGIDGANYPMWDVNATRNPAPGQPVQQCDIVFSGGRYPNENMGIYGSSSFQFDLAWVHFFDKTLTKEDVVRECNTNWIYTQFPDSYNKYVSLSV